VTVLSNRAVRRPTSEPPYATELVFVHEFIDELVGLFLLVVSVFINNTNFMVSFKNNVLDTIKHIVFE